MNTLEKSIELNHLYDLYQELLTDKQRDYFEQYYFDDYSITEISENRHVSRNAVHDLIKRTVLKLYDFEAKLNLHSQQKQRQEIIQKMEKHTTNSELLLLLEELSKVE